jgi:hypothetical protein
MKLNQKNIENGDLKYKQKTNDSNSDNDTGNNDVYYDKEKKEKIKVQI